MGKTVPDGPDWLHEVKYDGYRMMLVREGKTVRLFTRGGYDWAKRYPWIVQSALSHRQTRFVIDGEAVLLGVDGVSDFNGLHSRQHDDEVLFYAFDVLVLGGDDLRQQPLDRRKAKLDKLLARRPDGIFVRTVRAWRDRPGLVRGGLPDGPRRPRVRSTRIALIAPADASTGLR